MELEQKVAEAMKPLAPKPVHRGTSNGNQRGGSAARRKRREYLVETYRANVDLVISPFGTIREIPVSEPLHTVPFLSQRVHACRCYRCGELLTVATVTVDRIIPGCKGGTYRRNNIRPACGFCNSQTGAVLRSKK
jgi:hypothetical protein